MSYGISPCSMKGISLTVVVINEKSKYKQCIAYGLCGFCGKLSKSDEKGKGTVAPPEDPLWGHSRHRCIMGDIINSINLKGSAPPYFSEQKVGGFFALLA